MSLCCSSSPLLSVPTSSWLRLLAPRNICLRWSSVASVCTGRRKTFVLLLRVPSQIQRLPTFLTYKQVVISFRETFGNPFFLCTTNVWRVALAIPAHRLIIEVVLHFSQFSDYGLVSRISIWQGNGACLHPVFWMSHRGLPCDSWIDVELRL